MLEEPIMIKITSFEFNPFSENTYVLHDETKECIIIDPGCYEQAEKEELKNFIHDHELTVKALLNTHCHIDHVLGNSYIAHEFKVELGIPKVEEPYLESVKAYAGPYGFAEYQPKEVDYFLDENKTIEFGNTELEILFVPGHSAGHVAFYSKKDQICIAGDVLFKQSIGRTDLPGGDFDTLISSIRNTLFQLPENTVIYPGHGPSTTIGFEKQHNPFLKN